MRLDTESMSEEDVADIGPAWEAIRRVLDRNGMRAALLTDAGGPRMLAAAVITLGRNDNRGAVLDEMSASLAIADTLTALDPAAGDPPYRGWQEITADAEQRAEGLEEALRRARKDVAMLAHVVMATLPEDSSEYLRAWQALQRQERGYGA